MFLPDEVPPMSQHELNKSGDSVTAKDISGDAASHRLLDDVFKHMQAAPKRAEVSNDEIDRRVDSNTFPLNEKEREEAKAIAKAAREGNTGAIKEMMANAKTDEERQEIKNAVVAAEQALAGTGIHLDIEEGSRMNGNESEPHDFLQLTITKDGHHTQVSSDGRPDISWDDQVRALEFPDIFQPKFAEATTNRKVKFGDTEFEVPADWDMDPGYGGSRKLTATA